MSVLYLLIPAALALGAAAVAAFVFATRSGQFDDMDTPPVSILEDDLATQRGSSEPAAGGRASTNGESKGVG
ncbi:MAG: cbb3-type cytochrome oxidase assembly protein CcoS [Planctomycetota bacterium]|jgi:cbb3-type cytochrome oxidase maturation protein